MDILNREDLLDLITRSEKNSLSIFMPTVRLGPETLQNPIRLKNLLDQAEARLGRAGLEPGEIRNLLSPMRELVDNREYWQTQGKGLAIFRSKNYYRMLEMPIEFDETVYLNDRFYIKPLIPILEDNGKYYLLALSMNKVHLYEGDRYGIHEMSLGDTPTSMAEALGYTNVQSYVQSHAGNKKANGSQRQAMFWGQGASNEDTKKEDILRFFQILEKGVYKQIGDQSYPLVLAGVEYLIPIYRDTNTYPHLFEESIDGNPEDRRPEDLHKEAWQMIQPFYEQARTGAVDAYHILANKGQASRDIQEIVPAAYFGQVDILFVSEGLRIWGKFDSENNQVTVHKRQESGDEDLTDLATAYTLSNNGTVYTLGAADMPDGASIAATLRYPLKGLNYEKSNKD